MNVDQEFFNIVEQLSPMRDISLKSFESHPATGLNMQDQSWGCGATGESACSANGHQEDRKTISSFPGLFPPVAEDMAPGAAADCGPADPTVTPFPKWDPQTRAWWEWDESRSGWLRKR